MPFKPVKFNYIAHDNQSKSVKNSDQEKKMDETNWSSDFYSDALDSFS